MTDPLWTSEDVARYVGLKGKLARNTIMDWVKLGKLKPALYLPGGKARFTKELVDKSLRRPQ